MSERVEDDSTEPRQRETRGVPGEMNMNEYPQSNGSPYGDTVANGYASNPYNVSSGVEGIVFMRNDRMDVLGGPRVSRNIWISGLYLEANHLERSFTLYFLLMVRAERNIMIFMGFVSISFF